MSLRPRIDEPIKKGGLVVESTFHTDEGYYGVCIFTEIGHRNGYVGVDKDHVLFGKHYDDLWYLSIHGGLTFANYNNFNGIINNYLWYLGFDCGHLHDALDFQSLKKYEFNHEGEDHYKKVTGEMREVRTLEYVKEEVKRLSSQMTPEALMRAKIEMERH